jgi:hypothetical protein
MIEEARASFEGYLKGNRTMLEKDVRELWRLRTEWLLANPDYDQFDLYLKVVWDDCYGEDGAKRAKGFHVEIVDELDYAYQCRLIERVENALREV